MNVFKTTEIEPADRYPRAVGRIVFGVVMLVGGALFVERVLHRASPEAAKLLAATWLAAFVLGWVVRQLAVVVTRDAVPDRLLAASWALPTLGAALLLPLTLHLGVALALGVDLHTFAGWAKLGLTFTGPAHVVFAAMATLRAVRIAQGRDAISTRRIYVTTVVVSAIPFVIVFFVPPLLVAFTGTAIVPLLDRMPRIIGEGRAPLPVAIVV